MTASFSDRVSENFKEFCQKTSLHGWKYIADDKRPKMEKYLWIIIQVCSFSMAVSLFFTMSSEFWTIPTVTTFESANYPISKVPFPALAICDDNRITKLKAMQLAQEMHKKLNVTVEKMFQYIKLFGKLYDFDLSNVELLNEYIQLLETTQSSTDPEEIPRHMLQLTPACDESLLACIYKGKQVNCKELFTTRRTMSGFCCMFNYIKPMTNVFAAVQQQNTTIDAKYLPISGYESGLTILLYTNISDYYYPLWNMVGFKIYVFNAHEYPDITCGGVKENLITPKKEIFLQIQTSTVVAVDELKQYTIEERDCIYSKEKHTLFDDDYYSYSECLAECKMRSILAICDCIPFYMPISSKLPFHKQICTFSDIACLNKYKEKWMTISPMKKIQGLEFELENSIQCSHCLPLCSYTKYDVMNEYAHLISVDNFNLKETPNISEVSVVHVYYDKENMVSYKTDLYFAWFDLVSNFGGLCGLFIGFSLISLMEILYFFTIRLLISK